MSELRKPLPETLPSDMADTLERIKNFVPRKRYATKFEDPFYQALVRTHTQQLRHMDAKDAYNQSVRRDVYGSFNTGGKAGLAPIAPQFGETDADRIVTQPIKETV